MSNKNICDTVELFLFQNYENLELLGPFENFKFGVILNVSDCNTNFVNFFLVSNKDIIAEFRSCEDSLRFDRDFFLSLINYFNVTPDICEQCLTNWWKKKFSEFNVDKFLILSKGNWSYMDKLI